MGVQPGTVSPERDFTHPEARPRRCRAPQMRKELSEATSRCAEVSEGRIGFLLFSPYPKYPNHVPLYE